MPSLPTVMSPQVMSTTVFPNLLGLDHQCKHFDFDVKVVGLDDCKIHGVIGYRHPNHRKGFLYKQEYENLPGIDGYRCPGG